MQITMQHNIRILKVNLKWSLTRAKFCRLSASFSIVLSQLKVTKLKLEYFKSDFKHKSDFFPSLEFDFFLVQLKFALRIRP